VRKAMQHVPAWPPGLTAAAIGGGTRRQLEQCGIRDVLAPVSGADSEALLALPELANPAGRRVVIFRGAGGRALLGDTLLARGARVEYAECYRRLRPAAESEPLLREWNAGRVHAVAVSSAEGLSNLFGMLGEPAAERLRSTPLFVGHERVADDARRLGARMVFVAGPGDAALVERLVAYFRPAK
jgi:uroporphyrinogen-III synthase